MHITRLRDLSSHLRKLEDQRIHTRSLGLSVETSCRGTAGNAVQIAAEWFHFQAQGLRLERLSEPCKLVPTFADLQGPEAIECFFEIDDFTYQLFFEPDTYDESELASPGAVARRIDFWLSEVTDRARPQLNTTELQGFGAEAVAELRQHSADVTSLSPDENQVVLGYN